ncbi:hypothetical protein L2E82_08187 [Cichorium intybus]|uniref:Uncharacterized protein n=1 Tax=Cichorium intybus TaxID=13427 RepID=A0ACB9G5U3_CICIN|nr:hypothetical protein L2E82_08187 [Cichorium intybus]
MDAKILEDSFGKITLAHNILVINIARFQRFTRTPVTHQPPHVPPPPPPPLAPISAWGFRGAKSFAKVVAGSSVHSPVTNNRINLPVCPEIDKTLFDTFLLGEVHEWDILKPLPNLLIDEGVIFGRVFFYGGLCTLIGFENKEDALGFLENESCWGKWFKWLKKGDSTLNWKFERVVDMKIVGLPIQLRTPENISKILSRYGKVLQVDEDIWKFTDLSCCEGRILTESKALINDEMVVDYGTGKSIKISIIEREIIITPFLDDEAWGVNNNQEGDDNESSDEGSGKDDSECGSDMDGLSDTWNNNDNEARKEGEIHLDEIVNTNGIAGESPIMERVPEAEESVIMAENGETETLGSIEVVEESHLNIENGIDGYINDPLNGEHDVRLNCNPVGGPQFFQVGLTPTLAHAAPGSLPNLPVSPKSFKNTSPFEVDHSNDKRRKVRPARVTPTPTMAVNSSPSIDLNRSVSRAHSVGTVDMGCDDIGVSHELIKTVEVGVNVGFEINSDDPTLREVVIGAGANVYT